jgi:hypothetical protein
MDTDSNGHEKREGVFPGILLQRTSLPNLCSPLFLRDSFLSETNLGHCQPGFFHTMIFCELTKSATCVYLYLKHVIISYLQHFLILLYLYHPISISISNM